MFHLRHMSLRRPTTVHLYGRHNALYLHEVNENEKTEPLQYRSREAECRSVLRLYHGDLSALCSQCTRTVPERRYLRIASPCTLLHPGDGTAPGGSTGSFVLRFTPCPVARRNLSSLMYPRSAHAPRVAFNRQSLTCPCWFVPP